MDCGSCAKTIEKSLRQMAGVTEVSVSFATDRLSVSYDPQRMNTTEIRNRVTALGYTVDVAPAKTLLSQIGGMDCGSCAKTIEASLQQMSGVAEVSVNFAAGRLCVFYEPHLLSERAIRNRIAALGYTVEGIRVLTPNEACEMNQASSVVNCLFTCDQRIVLTTRYFWICGASSCCLGRYGDFPARNPNGMRLFRAKSNQF